MELSLLQHGCYHHLRALLTATAYLDHNRSFLNRLPVFPLLQIGRLYPPAAHPSPSSSKMKPPRSFFMVMRQLHIMNREVEVEHPLIPELNFYGHRSGYPENNTNFFRYTEFSSILYIYLLTLWKKFLRFGIM